MRKNKKLLLIVIVAILAVSIPVTLALIHRGQEPSNGEVPSDNSTEPTVPPITPSTLTVLSITDGDVFVMKAGTGNWTEAQVGISLEAGDVVKSGDNSNAEITFFDGSTIELQAGTEIEVVSLGISDTGSTTIKLKQAIGNTISRVEKLVDSASCYEIETPACVAAVRGSSMLVQVIADGTTWVTNQEGEIWVIANGVELQIPEGRKCIIIPGQPPQLVTQKSSGGGGGGGGFITDLDIAITKASNVTQTHEGNTITYTYTVTNPGNVPLSNVSVTDDVIEQVTYQSGDTNGNGRLDVGETWIFTATYDVTAGDPTPLVNTAAAAGTYSGSGTIIAWASASVNILRPDIAIDKTGELVWHEEGFYSSIEYTFTITNPGNTPLSNISVSDNMTEEVTHQSGDTDEDDILDTDETWIFTATYDLYGQEESPLLFNTASVSGTDALSLSVWSESSATVDILWPAIAIDKTGELWEDEVYCINYTYTITNPGNTPLSDITVSDNMTEEVTHQSGDTNENGLLDTDETWVFTATYYLTGEDPDPVENYAFAYGTDPLGHTVTAGAYFSIYNPYLN